MRYHLLALALPLAGVFAWPPASLADRTGTAEHVSCAGAEVTLTPEFPLWRVAVFVDTRVAVNTTSAAPVSGAKHLAVGLAVPAGEEHSVHVWVGSAAPGAYPQDGTMAGPWYVQCPGTAAPGPQTARADRAGARRFAHTVGRQMWQRSDGGHTTPR